MWTFFSLGWNNSPTIWTFDSAQVDAAARAGEEFPGELPAAVRAEQIKSIGLI